MSNKLKLNGYYYYADRNEDGYETMYPLFLYNDGSVLKFGEYFIHLINKEQYFSHNHTHFQSNLKSKPTNAYHKDIFIPTWGFYTVDNDNIQIQVIGHLSSGIPIGVTYYVAEYKGKILNDSTFLIDYKINYKDDLKDSVKQIFKFYKYDFKPDSANWLKDKFTKRKTHN